MKHYLSTFAGSAICGGFAFGIWPELWKTYGLMGGWLAATLIIGIMSVSYTHLTLPTNSRV